MFDADAEGESTCLDGCAAAWPPLLVEGDAVPALAEGLDPAMFSIVEHPNGPMLKVGDWPLYYFANDTAPGDLNGQGANEVWWLVAPDGTPVRSTAPAASGAAAPATTDASGY
jgi:predicted lipoprotein with Yx(FWY)xxD motif